MKASKYAYINGVEIPIDDIIFAINCAYLALTDDIQRCIDAGHLGASEVYSAWRTRLDRYAEDITATMVNI